MTEGKVLEVTRHALEIILIVGGPVLIVGLVVGVIISIFQAATQVNEPTLSFLPKMVAMFATFFCFRFLDDICINRLYYHPLWFHTKFNSLIL